MRFYSLAIVVVLFAQIHAEDPQKECFPEFYELNRILLNCAQLGITNDNFSFPHATIPSIVYILDLSRNNISHLSESSLRRFGTLTVLELQYNAIRSIDAISLKSIPTLENLNLSFNFIERLDWESLALAPSLKFLDISRNRIKIISPLSFEYNLGKLVIADNPISSLQNLPPSLQFLDASQTLITSQELKWLKGLNRLVYLKLEGILGLNETFKDSFTGLVNLNDVSLKGCRNLVRLDEDTFSGSNKNLKWIDLSGCGLETLSKKLEPVLIDLKWLDLRSNPWFCDKRIHWMWRLKASPTVILPEFRCYNPPSMRGTLASDFVSTRVRLHAVHSKMLAAIWLLIFSGATVIIVFMVKRKAWKRKRMDLNGVKYSVRRYNRLTESMESLDGIN